MAGNTIQENKLKAMSMRDRADNPWLPYYLPRERYEVVFADVEIGIGRYAGVFSHANDSQFGYNRCRQEAAVDHRRTIREWAESVGIEHMALGVASAYFINADDAMLCRMAFS